MLISFFLKKWRHLTRHDVMTQSHRKSRLPLFRAENIFRKSHQRNFGCWSSWLDGTPTGTYVAYTQLVYIGGYSCVYATLHISAHNVAKKYFFPLLMSLSSKSVEKVTILVWNNLHRVVTINGLIMFTKKRLQLNFCCFYLWRLAIPTLDKQSCFYYISS